jgi:hypothetical protein
LDFQEGGERLQNVSFPQEVLSNDTPACQDIFFSVAKALGGWFKQYLFIYFHNNITNYTKEEDGVTRIISYVKLSPQSYKELL